MKRIVPLKRCFSLLVVVLSTVVSNAQPIYKLREKSKLSMPLAQNSPPKFVPGPSLQSLTCLGGSGDEGGFSNFMTQTSDGGFISCSYSNSTDGNVATYHGGYDVWLVKFNSQGAIQWKRSYGGSGDDYANRAIQTSDGGYIFLGYTTSNDGDVSVNYGQGDLWLVKLNASGGIVWQKSYGGSGDEFAYYGIIQAMDGGYALIGSSASHNGDASGNHGGYDMIVLKLSAPGMVQWSKTYGGSEDDYGNLIVQNSDGTYTITGDTYSNNGNIGSNHGSGTLDTWVARLTNSGTIIWKRSLGGSEDEFNASLITTHDGGILVGDYAGSHDGDVTGNHGIIPDGGDMWLVKLNSSGSIVWTKTLGGGNGSSPIDFPDDEVALFLAENTNGEFLVAGGATSSDGDVMVNRGGDDAWLLRLDARGNILWQKSFGGSAEDAATAIFQNSNGGYTVGGWSSSNDYDFKHAGQHGGSDLFFGILSPDNISLVATNRSNIESTSSFQGTLQLNNFPNPFSQATTISFFVPTSGSVSLKVFDVQGKLVKTLFEGLMEQRNQTVLWNATNQHNNRVVPGVYVLMLQAGNHLESKKVFVLR
jgi:hypothetical protein